MNYSNKKVSTDFTIPVACIDNMYSLLITTYLPCTHNPDRHRSLPVRRQNAVSPSLPSLQITELILHLHIRLLPLLGCRLFLPEVFEQVATLEILIRMHDRLELCSTPRAVFFNFLDFLLVCVFENPSYRQRLSSSAGNASKRIITERRNTYRLQAI